MIVEANGVSFRCDLAGEQGNPYVILSNSLMTTLELWDGQVEALSEHFRVIRYDQRGHGKTAGAECAFSFDDLVTDMVSLLDALDVEKANLIGLSMGGTTVMGVAERYPERVERLVVCDSSGSSTPAAAKQWAERIAVAKERGMEALVDATIGRWFPAEVIESHAAHLDRVRKMIASTPVEGFRHGAEALSNVDFARALSEVKAPTMFMVGTEDAVAPAMRQLHAVLEGSQLIELSGAGHLSNLDAPDAFNSALMDFLRAENGQ